MRNRAKIYGIKILLVGDVPDAHLVLRALQNNQLLSQFHYLENYEVWDSAWIVEGLDKA